jgi:hypothetical protein
MKRDMDLVRGILLEIENSYVSTAICDLHIDGYDMNTIAYHCKILHEVGFISDYKAQYADNKLYSFRVGSLTWEGNDYLDKVRDNTIWRKTKDAIKDKGLPFAFDTIKIISTAFITAAAEGVANSILKNGGQI